MVWAGKDLHEHLVGARRRGSASPGCSRRVPPGWVMPPQGCSVPRSAAERGTLPGAPGIAPRATPAQSCVPGAPAPRYSPRRTRVQRQRMPLILPLRTARPRRLGSARTRPGPARLGAARRCRRMRGGLGRQGGGREAAPSPGPAPRPELTRPGRPRSGPGPGSCPGQRRAPG